VSDHSTCLPSSVLSPQAWRPLHVVPVLRLGTLAASTAWAIASLGFVRASTTRMHHWSRTMLRRLGVVLEIHGRPQDGPRLWVANHLSWLDPLVLMSLRPMGALAKYEVATYPFIGRPARRLGLAFVNRTDPTSRAAALTRLAADLRRGEPMLLFPEGTTTRGQGLAPLQEGGLRAAYRCGVAVQTIQLTVTDPWYPWIGDDTLLPHLLTLSRARSTRLRLAFGEALDPRQFVHEEAWCQAIQRQLDPASRGSHEP